MSLDKEYILKYKILGIGACVPTLGMVFLMLGWGCGFLVTLGVGILMFSFIAGLGALIINDILT